ncbi:hypothetical protein K470DRAFT_254331 [Piedraia hortae CBS 480.64]|uniref:DUF7598 domain-containing protein n=1 Tax=Piedraia hortae CBS 480.64 TaxID=1314780 RepID=A0A6A7C8V7_9PEZI|nr:hypothetical protein K470DRAFT_254331 [Piedraia hortae CBS 480.64]
MALSGKSLAGPGYIILNGIRVMNIISLLAIIAACVVMLVKTTTSTNFFFFDAASHVLTALASLFLFTSELPIFQSYFARSWPLLSLSHGFVALSVAMIFLGINMLGNLNDAALNKESLGLTFWRVVIGSGILIFILGFINLISSFVFRDRAQGITARQVRAYGAVAIEKAAQNKASSGLSPLRCSTEKTQSPLPSYHSRRYSHRGSTSFSPNSPSYHSSRSNRRDSAGSARPMTPLSPPITPPAPLSPSSKYSRATNCTKKKVFSVFGRHRQSLAPPLPVNASREVQISPPMGVNPQFAHLVQRPESAVHPSRSSNPYFWNV